MSQEELGEILGVKKSAIQKYESGAVTDLKASTIRILCETFHTYPWFFVSPEHHKLIEEIIRKINEGTGEGKRVSQSEMVMDQLVQKQRVHDVLALVATATELTDKGFERLISYAAELRQIKEYMGDIRPRQ